MLFSTVRKIAFEKNPEKKKGSFFVLHCCRKEGRGWSRSSDRGRRDGGEEGRRRSEEGPTGGAVWEAMASAIAKRLARIQVAGDSKRRFPNETKVGKIPSWSGREYLVQGHRTLASKHGHLPSARSAKAAPKGHWEIAVAA